MIDLIFFGGGNISQSIISGLLNSGYSKKNIFFLDRNIKNQNKLKKLGIKKFNRSNNSSKKFFILAVKPKDAIAAYNEILLIEKKPLIISLVAGIKIKQFLKISKSAKLMRAMPNTSSKYNHGITALHNGCFSLVNFQNSSKIFKKIGITIILDKENKMDQFTGIIGSGPAYFFYILQTFEKKLLGVCNGNKELVNEIIINLLNGVSSSIGEKSDLKSLVRKVASKKGTTEAGLNTYKKMGLNKILESGLNSAIKRSKDISNEYR